MKFCPGMVPQSTLYQTEVLRFRFRSDASMNFAAKLVSLYTGPYWVTKKLSDVNYRLNDVTSGKDAGVFQVENMEPFYT